MKILFILLAVIILLLMITIHEFGHYIAGKLLGFKIEEFSIGFGPKIFSKKKKNGEVFSIRLLPLGGFCAFAGESEEENILAPEKLKKSPFDENDNGTEKGKTDDKDEKSADPDESVKVVAVDEKDKIQTAENKSGDNSLTEGKKFNDQPPWKRIIVLMAGGVFNILSAVIFSFIFICFGAVGGVSVNNVYKSVEPNIQYTLEAGDKIVSIEGQKIDFYHPIEEAMANRKEGETIEVVVLRDGEEKTLTVTLHKYDPSVWSNGSSAGNYEFNKDENGNEIYPVGMGISLLQEHATVGDAFKYSIPYTAKLSWMILGAFGDLITGKVPISQVSGTIGTIDQMANYGMENWAYMLVLLPLIAANLGIFNLFPIPALDGAKVVFTIVEWIRGKPVNPKVENMIHMVGLFLLLGLVVVLDLIYLVSRYII